MDYANFFIGYTIFTELDEWYHNAWGKVGNWTIICV